MMTWDLADDYRVRCEPLNFVLECRHRTKPSTKHPEGRDTWRVIGYFSGLSAAILAIPDDVALRPEVQDFKGLKRRLEALSSQLARRVGRV